MQMGSLVLIERKRPTNLDHFLLTKLLTDSFLQPAKTVEDSSSDKDEALDKLTSPPSQNVVDKAIEILNRLTLFTTDLDLDPLVLKISNKINQRRMDGMKKSPISDFKKKTITTVF